jgi:hypothetical protein
MTLEQLKTNLDNYIGMTSTIMSDPDISEFARRLEYRSPSGVTLFTVRLGTNRQGTAWKFGGTSDALPGQWDKLCTLDD